MSLPIPNLDDITFDDLMKEAKALIPMYDKEWTNHNPSDPGITLLELFSWLCEMVIYRINQVPEKNYRNFLKLLNVESITACSGTISSEGGDVIGDGTSFTSELKIGDSITFPGSDTTDDQMRKIITIDSDTSLTIDSVFDPVPLPGTKFCSCKSIDSGICEGLETLSKRYRAITAEDYEYLAKKCMEALQKGLAGRVICVNNWDLEYRKKDKGLQPGYVSVIIIPRCCENPGYCENSLPTEELKKKIKEYLDARKLITTRLRVVGPDYNQVKLQVWVSLKENTLSGTVINDAVRSIKIYFDPIKGGKDGKGWMLGRPIYRSEIFQLLEGIKGVDHVVKVKINDSDKNLEIENYQLILLETRNIEVNIQQ